VCVYVCGRCGCGVVCGVVWGVCGVCVWCACGVYVVCMCVL